MYYTVLFLCTVSLTLTPNPIKLAHKDNILQLSYIAPELEETQTAQDEDGPSIHHLSTAEIVQMQEEAFAHYYGQQALPRQYERLWKRVIKQHNDENILDVDCLSLVNDFEYRAYLKAASELNYNQLKQKKKDEIYKQALLALTVPVGISLTFIHTGDNIKDLIIPSLVSLLIPGYETALRLMTLKKLAYAQHYIELKTFCYNIKINSALSGEEDIIQNLPPDLKEKYETSPALLRAYASKFWKLEQQEAFIRSIIF